MNSSTIKKYQHASEGIWATDHHAMANSMHPMRSKLIWVPVPNTPTYLITLQSRQAAQTKQCTASPKMHQWQPFSNTPSWCQAFSKWWSSSHHTQCGAWSISSCRTCFQCSSANTNPSLPCPWHNDTAQIPSQPQQMTTNALPFGFRSTKTPGMNGSTALQSPKQIHSTLCCSGQVLYNNAS